MKRFSRRFLSMLLAVAMVFGLSGMTAFAAETDAEEPAAIADTEEYDVKYAVTIWGIEQDKDEKGRTLGITFGPATGADYRHDYVAHLDEDEYDPDNDQFCIHWMSWEEIARQCRIDPEVFEDCLEAGCTHSVNIVLNDELLGTSYAGEMDDGDGSGVLRYSIKSGRAQWNYTRTTTWGYPGSQVRAVLVGKDENSKAQNNYMPDAEHCLFTCFPEELQNEIIAKEVDSYSNYNMRDSDSQIVYDKLWLFSGKETFVESGAINDAVIHPLEGELYQRSELLDIGPVYGTGDLIRNWAEEGARSMWWLRSMTQDNNTQAYAVIGTGVPTAYDTTQSTSGLAPGFCLQGVADLTELEEAIAAAEALNEADYTPASWDVLAEALAAAYEVLDTTAVRQSAVDEAAEALQDAIDNLVIMADKTALEETINAAEALDWEDYTDASWKVLQDALTKAKEVDGDINASQAETDAAQAELEDAMASLVEAADKTALENAISTAEGLAQDKDCYTTDSWDAVETALAPAQEVYADRDVTQAEVDEAADALISAIANLVKADGQTVDKSELLSTYEYARSLSESDYTLNSWTELQSAIADAQTVLLDVNATQEEVANALNELQSALGVLVDAADKTALLAAVEEAYELDEEDYTPSSWTVLESALAAAETVLSDKNAVQKDADEALGVLQDALAGLVERADMRDLEAAIEAALALENTKDIYTSESWEALEAALAAAQAIDGDVEALQEDVDDATVNLVTAAAALVLLDPTGEEADKSELLTLYEAALRLTESEYSKTTWEVLAEALLNAQAVLMDSSASQDAVDEARDALQAAMDGLKPPAPAAFAIYSADDKSLTFYAEANGTFPKEGSTYHDKEATAVYREVDELSATGTDDIPWYELGENVKSVEIDSSFAQAQPVSLAYWFYGCRVDEISGVEYIDTSETTSLAYTFCGCDALETLDVSDWDTSNVTTMYGLFSGCMCLKRLDLSEWDVSNAATMGSMFYNCNVMTSIGDVSNWDTSANMTMASMFSSCFQLAELDLSKWNTSKVTSMANMFYRCTSLTSVGDLSVWVTSANTTMANMFYQCSSLAEVDMSGWDTENVTSMASLFYGCSSMTDIGDLAGWNTENVTSMSYLFYQCSALTSLDLSSWDTAKVKSMSYMFADCGNLKSLEGLADWNTANVTDMERMFYRCSNLKNVDVADWNTANVTSMAFMFYCCSGLTSLDISGWDTTNLATPPDAGYTYFAISCSSLGCVTIGEMSNIFTQGKCLSQQYWYDSPDCDNLVSSNYLQDVKEPGTYWTPVDATVEEAFAVYSATDDSLTFYKDVVPSEGDTYNGKVVTTVYEGVDDIVAAKEEEVPWSDIREDVASVTIDGSFAGALPVSLAYWFDEFSSASFSGLSNIDTSEVASFRRTFSFCSAMTDVDLSGWDTAKATDLYGMFFDCPALTSVDGLSDWDTSAITTLYGMFYNCSSLTSVGDLSGWDTANVTDMRFLFRDCSSLTGVGDLSGWETENVTSMEQMFCDCTRLTGLDVSSWNTSNVTDMSYMFLDCVRFTSLDLSGWDTTSVTNNESFAIGCSALEWVAIGEKTNIFRLGQCVTQQNWYDGPEKGSLVSSDYLQDVEEAGTYWTYTTGLPEAFAVYSATDDSLSFYYDSAPEAGESYHDKEATTVYHAVENVIATNENGVPWYDIREDVTSVEVDASFAEAKPQSLAFWFNYFENAAFGGLEYIDTSEVTSLRRTFSFCGAMTDVDLSGWDTANVTTMYGMFYDCPALTGVGDLSGWETSANTNMFGMFYEDSSMTSLDLSGWDTANVTTMQSLFYRCSSLTGMGDLSDWDTANVTNMQYLFYNCASLSGVDVASWNTAQVTDMSYMFRNCSALTSLDLSGWDTTSVTDNTNFATGCSALECVAIGENTNIFTLGQCVTQRTWYDSPENGSIVSSDYLTDVYEAGTYWASTTNATEAFAIYSATDDSLTFYYDIAPTAGETYKNKAVTTVYRNVDDVAATGTSGIPWYGLREDVTSVEIDDSFTGAKPVSLAYWFNQYDKASFSGLDNIDTSEVTSLRRTFSYCSVLSSLDLSGWDTAKVTDMYGMFYDCPLLTDAGDLSGWDTSATTTLYGMFYNDSSLTSLDLSGWDTAKVTNMQYMFRDCSKLASVGDLSGWDTAKVTNLSETFRYCSALTSLDLSGWDTGSVTTGTNFATDCSALEWVAIGENTSVFRLERCVTQRNWYDGPENGALVSSNYLQDVTEAGKYWTSTTNAPEAFAVYSATDDSLTFYEDVLPTEGGTYKNKAATTVYTDVESLAASNADSVPWYDKANSVTSVVIDESFAAARPISLAYWFNGFANASFSGLEYMDTSEVTTLRSTFANCGSAGSLDVAGWDTAKVTTLREMFNACGALTSLDLSGWDTSKVTSMSSLFYNCPSLTGLGDLSGWNTSANTNMSGVFYNCSGLTSLDLSGWDTAKVTTMTYLFQACSNLTDVGDLSEWNTANVTNMTGTFRNCASLTSIDISGWDTTSVTTNTNFATGSSALEWVAIGEKTNIFTLGQCVTQPDWYDSATNGTLVSSDYLTDVTDPGKYWTYTEVVIADRSELQAEYDADLLLSEDDYTANSWAVLQDALASAKTVLDNTNASGEEIGTALVELQNARNALVKAADKTALQAEYDADSQLNEKNYTTASWAPFAEALAAAKDVLDDKNAAQSAVDSALAALQDARSALVEACDKTELEAEYNADSQLKEADYTPDSWAPFAEALAAAKEVIDNGDATQTQVNEALGALQTAKSSLAAAADKTALREEYEQDILLNEDDYTPATWEPFAEALAAAEEILDDANATQTQADEALGTLQAAREGLTKAADKAKLQMEYDEDIELNEDDYSEDSWAPFAETLATAKEVLDDANATQTEVDDALSALQSAKDSLVKVDYRPELEAEYDADKDLSEADYTPASWAPFAEALENAREVLEDTESTNKELKAALDALEAARESLLEAGDKTGLDAVIAEAEALKQDDYTASSWAALKEALDAAETVADDPNATQDDVDKALNNLESAMDALVEAGDKTELQAEYDADSQLKEADYTPATWGPFAEALSAAKGVLDNEDATQDDVDAALSALTTARENLVEAGDKTGLQAEYDADSQLKEADYTPATWGPFAEALSAAKVVLDNEDATQDDVDAALSALTIARENLVKAADKTALQAEYNEDKNLNEADYTTSTWAPFAEALATAKEVLDDDNASQDAVNAALSALETAKGNLTEAADKTNLEDVIASLEAQMDQLNQGDYTAASWAALETALADAEGVDENGDATQDEVTNATDALVAAAANLQSATGGTIDKSDLLSEYTEDLQLNDDNYTDDSWSAFAKALSNAQSVLINVGATEAEVSDALATLQSAKSNLGEKPSVSNVKVSATETAKTYDGKGITLTASAEYSPDTASVSCQWYKDGTAVNGATGSELVLNGNVSDSGTYKYVVTATSGLVSASAEAEIRISITAASQSISYATTSVSKTVGDAAFTNTLTQTFVSTEAGAGISYKSSNTSVATVDGNGKVTILSDGTTTITATAASTANYKEATASYTLTVAKASTSGTGGSVKKDIVNLNGTWTYTENGTPNYNYTGFATNQYGAWWVDNGVVRFNVTDIRNDEKGAIGSTSSWYYVIDSKVQDDYTGVSHFANAYGWWYIKNGKVDFSVNSVEENQYGWWYVVAGKVVFTDTVAQNRWGWWYCTGGKVDFGFSGLGNHGNAYGWWYIKNGKVDFSANTVAQNKYGWWYVEGGMVQFGYTGVANYENPYGWWYLKNGKVDFGFTGIASNKWGRWNVVNGKVQF